jgi:hypothetical protein
MRGEAALTGFYKSRPGNHASLQIFTVPELLEGKRIDARQMGRWGRPSRRHLGLSWPNTICRRSSVRLASERRAVCAVNSSSVGVSTARTRREGLDPCLD